MTKAKKPARAASKHSAPAARKAERLDKARKARPRSPRQRPLPTFEQVRHTQLDDLCVTIGDARQALNDARTDEESGKQAALAYMREHNVTVYKHAGIELVMVPGHDVLRVRPVKDGDAVVVGTSGNEGGTEQ